MSRHSIAVNTPANHLSCSSAACNGSRGTAPCDCCIHQSLTFSSVPIRFVCKCRKELWFWDSVVLFQTFGIAAAQVFATALDPYFQLIIMQIVLMFGVTILSHCRPFKEALPQNTQVHFSPPCCEAYCAMYYRFILHLYQSLLKS